MEQERICENIPIAVVNLSLPSKQVPLARLLRVVSADLVPVFFGLEERDEMNAGPDFLTSKLAIIPRNLASIIYKYHQGGPSME